MSATSQNEKTIFLAAAEIAAENDRAAFLDRACAGDPQLRAAVVALLHSHQQSQGLLDATAAPLAQPLGTMIGPYKLLQQIGEGGMGTVYMAEQTEPVQRRVAIKIIKPGMDSRQVIARFAAERQALALMDHVNIARVLDAGVTEQGRPYFVMELIHGVPITKYCDDNHLTPRQRLELFVPVCQAIQHAHQKGVIHRDIKPSNVMITLYDGKPVPKVIDFGVAKAIDQKLTEQTLFTQYGTMVGTLEYMSPEQAEMSALGVDTRSDIYSLGVLLYELLTGGTPLSRQQMKEAAFGEILRLIKEVEPPKPSTRLSESGESLASISAQRQTEPAKLSKLMRGELDWIVMKTLEKDRNRRYETANGFAADIQRYLADEPVSACPPSAPYRLRKFARKNRSLLATAAALGVLLIVATIGTGIAAVQSSRLADREQELRAAAEQRADIEAKGRDELNQKLYLNRIALAQQELYAQNTGRAHELLDECPAPLRGWEWRFLKRFRPGNPMALPGSVGCATFSPDGRFLATRRDDKLVDIIDCETGEKIRTLQASSTWIDCYGLAFGRSDGETLLAVGDAMGKVVKIWNVDTGQELRTLEGHAVRLRNVAFSPNGRHLAAGSIAGGAKVWDWKSGEIVFELPRASVSRFAYSPDRRRLAIAVFDPNHGVEVHDAATGREIRAFGNHDGGTESVAYHPHASHLATCGNDGTVKIWDEATGTLLRTLRGHTGPVKDVVFTPDGDRVVSAGWDKTLKVWEVETGQETLTLRGHADTVMKLEFSRDGNRLASAGNEDVKIWDAPPVDEAAPLGVMSVLGHSNVVTSVAFSPNGRLLATGDADRLINVWNVAGLAQGRITLDRSFQRDPDIGVSIAFSPDSRRLASAGWVDARIQVWDTETSRSIILPVHKPLGGRGLAYSPDGQRIASTGPGAIGECDAITGENLWSDKALGNMNGLAYSPDGKYLAVSNYSRLNIRDRDSSKELRTLEHPAIIWGTAFSPDSQRVVTACFDHTLRLWDPTNGREIREFRGHTARTICVAFSPDGQQLASGSEDSTVKVWDVASGRELITLRGHRGYVWSVAFSPNGLWLSSSGGHPGNGEVKIWVLAHVLDAACQPGQSERARRHAVEFYRMTASAQPKVWEHQRNLGQACIQAKHWDEATLAYSTAIELNPTACPNVIAALMANGQDAECRTVVRGVITAVERMANDQPDRKDLRRAQAYTSNLLNAEE